MSNKIIVKRTKRYIRFLMGKKEILITHNIYTNADTDESLIKYCLKPWLMDFLKENRNELKSLIIQTKQIDKDIQLHQKALDASKE